MQKVGTTAFDHPAAAPCRGRSGGEAAQPSAVLPRGLPGRIQLLYHTLKYLRPVQLYARLWFKWHRPRISLAPAPARRAPAAPLCTPPARAASMLGPTCLSFLGQAGVCREAADWNDPERPKLWLYNLHYFDDLTAVDAADRLDWQRALIARWIAENPVAQGNGWEPYPLSLRIVNWIQWSLLYPAAVPDGFADSLALQLRYLAERIEWHLQGNHLFVNGKALMMAGLYFDGEEGQRWLRQGWHIVARELEEEFLDDGAHFELSPMYHSIMLRDLLDLLDCQRAFPGVLARAAPTAECRIATTVARGREWLHGVCHPDGDIALMNDAAFGVAPHPASLNDYAAALGLPPVDTVFAPLHHFAASGHVRWARDGWFALLDVGAIGPDYLPGHAHADSLGFELSVGAERVIVDSGTGEYGDSAERLRQRGSAAHNVVTVDGQNSSEVWSGFRVARRARVHDVELSCAQPQSISAWHDGYRRLPGRVDVHRQWRYEDGWLHIIDRLDGRFASAVSHLHFGPGVQVLGGERGHYRLLTPGGRTLALRVHTGEARLLNSSWHPRFGSAEPIKVLAVALTNARAAVALQLRGD